MLYFLHSFKPKNIEVSLTGWFNQHLKPRKDKKMLAFPYNQPPSDTTMNLLELILKM
jgi:hypothetical protein